MQESAFLHFSEHTLQEFALVFMAVIYTLRLMWIFKFAAGGDKQGKTGRTTTDHRKGALYSLANIAMPWAMESTRKNLFFYIQFVLFHLGVVAAITLSFVIPYGPKLLENGIVQFIFQAFITLAFIVGCIRIYRRITDPYIRSISTPDDYFSLILLTIWFFTGILAAPNNFANGEGELLAFFLLTAFFLVYVPFSKISHYLYYPITRYYLGKTLGTRGVFPIQRGPQPH